MLHNTTLIHVLYLNAFKILLLRFKYGSGQLVGSSTKETPEALVGMKNVIVVTFNYRLNVFGFLTLGTDKVPGNTAIADQTKALMWVKKNIAMFGGDPYKITLFGDGYGARSIQMQLFNDYAYGLFDKAAISSGADASWAVPTREYAAKKWWMYADVLGCVDQMHNTTLTGACLQVLVLSILCLLVTFVSRLWVLFRVKI